VADDISARSPATTPPAAAGSPAIPAGTLAVCPPRSSGGFPIARQREVIERRRGASPDHGVAAEMRDRRG
jgi:hypothetical protein